MYVGIDPNITDTTESNNEHRLEFYGVQDCMANKNETTLFFPYGSALGGHEITVNGQIAYAADETLFDFDTYLDFVISNSFADFSNKVLVRTFEFPRLDSVLEHIQEDVKPETATAFLNNAHIINPDDGVDISQLNFNN